MFGLLETKIKHKRINRVAVSMFGGWKYYSNHSSHHNGQSLVVWKEDVCEVTICSESDQAVTCLLSIYLYRRSFIAPLYMPKMGGKKEMIIELSYANRIWNG